MRHDFYEKYPYLSIKEILEKHKYYNIAAFLLAAQGDFEPIIEIYGERMAFINYRNIMQFHHECKLLSEKRSAPLILTNDYRIFDWHWHLASKIIADNKIAYYIQVNESAGDYGDTWVTQYKCSEKLIEYYKNIPSIWNLE